MVTVPTVYEPNSDYQQASECWLIEHPLQFQGLSDLKTILHTPADDLNAYLQALCHSAKP